MYIFGLAVAAGLLCGQLALQAQTAQSPQELLKEAVAFHQQGKLEEAIGNLTEATVHALALRDQANIAGKLATWAAIARAAVSRTAW